MKLSLISGVVLLFASVVSALPTFVDDGVVKRGDESEADDWIRYYRERAEKRSPEEEIDANIGYYRRELKPNEEAL
ncbi:hypothetical protein DL93DRAFT_2167129 [Clavulina sp. PMI_390]|nr:hypothetical protein DL93DRAFT_2167129 [Clavulina sp. PMI_390]